MRNHIFTIGLDLGTSAVKGVLFDGMHAIACNVFEVDLLSAGDSIEFEPELYWVNIISLIRHLAKKSPTDISGIAMCVASGNTLITDENGIPLTRIISWLDKHRCEAPDNQVHEVVGWPWNGGFPYEHIKRIKTNHPELFTRAIRISMNNDWIHYRLCGKRALDYSSATPFFLQDQKTFRYHAPYLEMLGITESMLPELVLSGSMIGTLNQELVSGHLTKNTHIVAGSFDHPSAARASGVTQPDEMLLSCGTSWVGFIPFEKRPVIQGKVLCDPYLSQNGGCWGAMFSMVGAGLEIEKFVVEMFGNEKDRYQKMTQDALAGGPALSMMRNIVRCFRGKLPNERIFRHIVLVGGPSESVAWRKVISEVLGAEIEISLFGKNAGAAGAAILAMEGLEK